MTQTARPELLDALIEGVQVSRVSDCDERALQQTGPHQRVATLGDPVAGVRLIGLTDFRYDADVSHQLIGACNVIDIANPGQHEGHRT